MINIRIASKQDVEVLFELIMGIAKYHDQEQFVLTTKEEMSKSGFDKHPRFGVFIAEFEGKVAGYLSYTWNYSIWKGSEYMNIDDLFIWREYRGKKIGNELMQYAKKVCGERGVDLIRWEVEKENVKVIEFYEKIGATMNVKGVFKWNF